MMNRQTFQDLNQRYFDERLPRYQVIVAPQLRHASGRIARRSRRIYLQPTSPDLLIRLLLHEMAHAATNDHHGPLWLTEMRRLQAMGAPVEDPNDYEERIPPHPSTGVRHRV
jgi:SprT-like family